KQSAATTKGFIVWMGGDRQYSHAVSDGFGREDPAGIASLKIGFDAPFRDFTVDDPKLTVKQGLYFLKSKEMLHQTTLVHLLNYERMGRYRRSFPELEVFHTPQIAIKQPARY